MCKAVFPCFFFHGYDPFAGFRIPGRWHGQLGGRGDGVSQRRRGGGRAENCRIFWKNKGHQSTWADHVIFGSDFSECKRGEDFGDSNVWQYVEYVTWGNLSCEPWLMTPEGAGYLFFADIFGVRRGMMKFMLFFWKEHRTFLILVFLIWKRNI